MVLKDGTSFKDNYQFSSMPRRTMGAYILLSDDTYPNFTTPTNWQPQLYSYQYGFNVLWFTFLNPQLMTVPTAFANLANCRGSSGCPSREQLIIFSIGGQVYGEKPWPFLATSEAAQAAAQKVAGWFSTYNIDGIDLDIEGSAGDSTNDASNAIVFVNALKEKLNSARNVTNNIITLPVYGYPQITAENELVNECFDKGGSGGCYGNIDTVGIMVYNDLESLQYVPDYANATNEWQGFPITVDVPSSDIIAGLEGTASSDIINQMAESVVSENLAGIMVWYASVYDTTRNKVGLQYGGGTSDASTMQNETGQAWAQALKTMNQ